MNNTMLSNMPNVEDLFDISQFKKEDAKLIITDIRAFFIFFFSLQVPCYKDGEIVTLGFEKILNVCEVVKELKKLKFYSWQIATKNIRGKDTVVVFYADIEMNTELIIQEMESFGWEMCEITNRKRLCETQFRAMRFVQSPTSDVTSNVFKNKYLYHWVPEKDLINVLEKGIEPTSKHRFLMYRQKVHLLNGDITKEEASELGWQLYNINTRVGGKYFLVRVDVEKILKNSKFYGDARCEAGVTTRFVIPKESLDLFGKIEYTNRDVYCGEMIGIIADNDTMKD